MELTSEDIKHFEDRVIKDPMSWQVYGLGEWGSLRVGGELVRDFNYEKHVCLTKYNSTLPLHISFDFNVLPHCSVSIFQTDPLIQNSSGVWLGGAIRCIDEIGNFYYFFFIYCCMKFYSYSHIIYFIRNFFKNSI